MSYYDSGDGRRCRRCKRKRLDDEPPEVRQYKTCAKCRIIERQKKKSKKPLAEETMAYGMRQLQEHGGWNDDYFVQDDYMEESSNKRTRISSSSSLAATAAAAVSAGSDYLQYAATIGDGHYDTSGYQQPLQQQHTPVQHFVSHQPKDQTILQQYPQQTQQQHFQQPTQQQQQHHQAFQSGPQSMIATSNTVNLNNNNNNINSGSNFSNNSLVGGGASGTGNSSYSTEQQYSQTQISNKPTFCEVCGTKIDIEVAHLHYNLCKTCCINPYRLPNVYEDFSDFLQEVAPDRNQDIATLTFIKEVVSPDFNESLDTNNVNPNNERQYRELILNSIKQIYLNPVMAATGYRFTRVSSNLAVASHTTPTVDPATGRYSYKNTQQVKALFKVRQDGIDTSNQPQLFVSYNLSTNIIIIKLRRKIEKLKSEEELEAVNAKEGAGKDESGFTTKETQRISEKYPFKLVNLVVRILKNSIQENTNSDIELGFNEPTGLMIFDILVNKEKDYPVEIQQLVASYSKEEFAKDFVSFEVLQNGVNKPTAELNGTVSESKSESGDVFNKEEEGIEEDEEEEDIEQRGQESVIEDEISVTGDGVTIDNRTTTNDIDEVVERETANDQEISKEGEEEEGEEEEEEVEVATEEKEVVGEVSESNQIGDGEELDGSAEIDTSKITGSISSDASEVTGGESLVSPAPAQSAISSASEVNLDPVFGM
ncbi:hypothetical protein CAAN1_23S01156 [[Candida] anglica]|uniref:Uncharacterized protein n=1 Tax=[Candida] anglica TaxID=148631 RepID=A0ABP0EB05_9ASCO